MRDPIILGPYSVPVVLGHFHIAPIQYDLTNRKGSPRGSTNFTTCYTPRGLRPLGPASKALRAVIRLQGQPALVYGQRSS